MKTNFLKFWLLLAVGFTPVVFNSCDEDEPNKKNPDPQTNTGSSVYVLDEKTIIENLQSINENGTLTFSSLTIDEMPKIDDVICSAPAGNAPRGFLYRVKSITIKDGQTTIETSEASLEEAIENVEMAETINLDDHIIGIFDEDGNPLEYTEVTPRNAQAQRAAAANKTSIRISRTFNGVTIEGNLTINNKLQFEMNINKWNLQYMKFAYIAETELKASISGELKGKTPLWNVKIATIKLAPITILVAGVPVVVTPEIPIYLNGELNGTLKGEFTLFDNKNSVTTGVLYQNDKVEGIFEKKSSESQSLAERMKVSLSGEFKTTVEPGISFLLYNSSNISVGATLGIYGKTTLTLLNSNEIQIIEDLAYNKRYALNPNLKVSIGAEASVMGQLKIFSKKIFDYRATKTVYETELLRGSVFPQFTNVSISDKTDNSAKATTTVQTPSYFNLIVPVSQHGICISTNPFPTVENSIWHNALGALPTVWNTATVPIVSANLQNLQKNTTYYVCSYFTNLFGTFYGNIQNFKTNNVEEPEEPEDTKDANTVEKLVNMKITNVDCFYEVCPGCFAGGRSNYHQVKFSFPYEKSSLVKRVFVSISAPQDGGWTSEAVLQDGRLTGQFSIDFAHRGEIVEVKLSFELHNGSIVHCNEYIYSDKGQYSIRK